MQDKARQDKIAQAFVIILTSLTHFLEDFSDPVFLQQSDDVFCCLHLRRQQGQGEDNTKKDIQCIIPARQDKTKKSETKEVRNKTKQDKKTRKNTTRQDKSKQDRTRQDKTRHDKTTQDKAKQDKARQDNKRQDKTRQDEKRAKQGKNRQERSKGMLTTQYATQHNTNKLIHFHTTRRNAAPP
jgi:hypothetical protein